MPADLASGFTPHQARIQAVLSLFRGEPAVAVSRRYGIGRSALYKFRQRAFTAITEALRNHRRGPRRTPNRISADHEAQTIALCQQHPTWSSYAVHRRGGAPSPRTIQRIRERHGLRRFSKRAPPMQPRAQATPETRARVAAFLTEKPHLGPERTVWDLQNSHQITISPSTIKRMKRKRREALLPPRPPRPAWRFYERRRPTACGMGTSWKRSHLPTSTGRPIS